MESVFAIVIGAAEIGFCIYNHGELRNIIVNIVIRFILVPLAVRFRRNRVRVGCFFDMSIVNFLYKLRPYASFQNMVLPLASVEIVRNNGRIVAVNYNIEEGTPPVIKCRL